MTADSTMIDQPSLQLIGVALAALTAGTLTIAGVLVYKAAVAILFLDASLSLVGVTSLPV